MARHDPRPTRRADARSNTELLLQAAKELFDEQGPDVALDAVARRAGVGNATLYRHFPTRTDLLIAAYADEVTALCDRATAAALAPAHDTAEALFTWLNDFVVHVATKRALALAITDGPGHRRTDLFERWHDAMRSAAGTLLARARDAGAVRPDLDVHDLLALAGALALAATDPTHAQRLLHHLRLGVETPPQSPAPRHRTA